MTLTATHDALLRAILEEPHADAPRLVYADWLEDRDAPGDREQAELIRVQVELAALQARYERYDGPPGLPCITDHPEDDAREIDLRHRAEELSLACVRHGRAAAGLPVIG